MPTIRRRAVRFLIALIACASSALARDRAVLVYPKEHTWFRSLFYTSHQIEMREQLLARYDVEVHQQVATAGALFGIDVSGAKLLVISGHGDPFALFLAGDEQRTIDWRDRARLQAFFAKLDDDATIVLQSCYSGRGFAYLVKEAAGPSRHVIAAKGDIPRDGLTVVSTHPLEIKITCRDEQGRPWDCTIRL